MGCGASRTKVKKEPIVLVPSKQEDIRDKYELGAILGSGSFGQVRQATLKAQPSTKRAVKMIERDNEDGEWSNQAIFVREVGLLQQINHENIIRYFDFYEDQHFLYVVMELCQGGEVFAKLVELRRFSEKNAALLGQQMLKAIAYIHKLHIAHRDIKAENFMLSEPVITSTVKMIDFGMATKFSDGQVLTELCGSPHYLAPELIGQKYSYRVDVWAFGVLMYLILYGHYPYDAKHPRDIMVKILTEPIRWQTKVKVSKNGLDFLKKVLDHEAKKRMTAEEALAHRWMQLPDTADTEVPSEVLRSAHKKVTASRKVIDPKIEEMRNAKLKQIDEDYGKGIRHGNRLGETPNTEEFFNKPEFVRRESKIATAPSRNMETRRASLQKMLESLSGSSRQQHVKDEVASNGSPTSSSRAAANSCKETGTSDKTGKPGSSQAASRSEQRDERHVDPLNSDPTDTAYQRKGGRSSSVSVPRRLSYIGAISTNEESSLASLFAEKRRLQPTLGVVPEPKCTLPGTSSIDDDVAPGQPAPMSLD